jgi:hypothetical protein
MYRLPQLIPTRYLDPKDPEPKKNFRPSPPDRDVLQTHFWLRRIPEFGLQHLASSLLSQYIAVQHSTGHQVPDWLALWNQSLLEHWSACLLAATYRYSSFSLLFPSLLGWMGQAEMDLVSR